MAYAGPATLYLRQDLSAKSAPVGAARHGERLDVMETRRRFAKVRTAQGVTGWADSNLLLNQHQMDELLVLSGTAARMPSQGAATVYEPVNMHTEPNRQSPSFFQIPENGSVEVLGHRVTPRAPPAALARPQRKPASPKSKAKDKRGGSLAPPRASAPRPPEDWAGLSRPRASDLPGYTPPPEPPPAAVDDWNLVRTRDGRAGWVLERMLTMAIPDEVAQYAEGHRITSYLPLADIQDGDQVKHNWLWTTVASGQHSYEFDSFRVFVWSTRRRRYETAYIDRNVTGYYPVEAREVPGEQSKGFSLVLQDKSGQLFRCTYGFSGYRVRLISKAPAQSPPLPDIRESEGFEPEPQPAPRRRAWLESVRDWRKLWTRR